ncbi:MAG: ribonuclease PH, partial [Nitrospinota bacterium]|nr:ribonuclease PH [Nitrospinota bacterium]
MRPVRIEVNPLPHAEGSVEITVGGTRVLCSATVEPGVPGWLKGKEEG